MTTHADDNFTLAQIMPRTEEDVLILPGMAIFHPGAGKGLVTEVRLGVVGPDAPRCHEKELTEDGRYWRKVMAARPGAINGKPVTHVNETAFWASSATRPRTDAPESDK